MMVLHREEIFSDPVVGGLTPTACRNSLFLLIEVHARQVVPSTDWLLLCSSNGRPKRRVGDGRRDGKYHFAWRYCAIRRDLVDKNRNGVGDISNPLVADMHISEFEGTFVFLVQKECTRNNEVQILPGISARVGMRLQVGPLVTGESRNLEDKPINIQRVIRQRAAP